MEGSFFMSIHNKNHHCTNCGFPTYWDLYFKAYRCQRCDYIDMDLDLNKSYDEIVTWRLNSFQKQHPDYFENVVDKFMSEYHPNGIHVGDFIPDVIKFDCIPELTDSNRKYNLFEDLDVSDGEVQERVVRNWNETLNGLQDTLIAPFNIIDKNMLHKVLYNKIWYLLDEILVRKYDATFDYYFNDVISLKIVEKAEVV